MRTRRLRYMQYPRNRACTVARDLRSRQIFWRDFRSRGAGSRQASESDRIRSRIRRSERRKAPSARVTRRAGGVLSDGRTEELVGPGGKHSRLEHREGGRGSASDVARDGESADRRRCVALAAGRPAAAHRAVMIRPRLRRGGVIRRVGVRSGHGRCHHRLLRTRHPARRTSVGPCAADSHVHAHCELHNEQRQDDRLRLAEHDGSVAPGSLFAALCPRDLRAFRGVGRLSRLPRVWLNGSPLPLTAYPTRFSLLSLFGPSQGPREKGHT